MSELEAAAERNLIGDPLDHGWIPHRPETWTHKYASLKSPLTMKHFTGKWKDGLPLMNEVPLESGHRVRIVMVSRFGDVGITEKLDSDIGYGARVSLGELCNFGDKP